LAHTVSSPTPSAQTWGGLTLTGQSASTFQLGSIALATRKAKPARVKSS
jgi:hypothetical protein